MFIRKIAKLLFVTALVLAMCVPASFAEDKLGERIVLTIGNEEFTEGEIIRVIFGTSDMEDDMMAMFMLATKSTEDRRRVVSDVSEALLFVEGAKDAGLNTRPDIAARIRWAAARILIEAYFDSVSDKWDFSKAAAEKYYKAHRADFTIGESVWAAHILTATESEALMAALMASQSSEGWAMAVENYSIDEESVMDNGSLGWIEKGMMPSAVEEAIMNGRPGQTIGPVQSEYGWHVIYVGERRPGRQLTFEEAQNLVSDSMETYYIETELAKIREKHPVKIDEEVISTLGGIPAPDAGANK